MLELFLIGFIGVLLPGPDMLLIISTTLYHGSKKAIITLLGILTGNFLYILPVIFGSYFILYDLVPWIMILGGIYLIYVGFIIYKSKTQIVQVYSSTIQELNHFYWKGLLTNLSNPKAMLYFASILLPALLKHDVSYIVIFFIGVVLAFLTLILFSETMLFMLKNHRYVSYSKIIFGLIFIFYGFYIFFDGIKELIH